MVSIKGKTKSVACTRSATRAHVYILKLSKFQFVYFKMWLNHWRRRRDSRLHVILAVQESARRRAPLAARNAASAPPRARFDGADRAARSVINKGGARLRARAPSRAFLALGSLTRDRSRPQPTLLPKTTNCRKCRDLGLRAASTFRRPQLFQCQCRWLDVTGSGMNRLL